MVHPQGVWMRELSSRYEEVVAKIMNKKYCTAEKGWSYQFARLVEG